MSYLLLYTILHSNSINTKYIPVIARGLVPAIDEELVGAGSLIGSAEQIAEVSAESYVNVTAETLEMSGEEYAYKGRMEI